VRAPDFVSLPGTLDGRKVRVARVAAAGPNEEILEAALEAAKRAGHLLALALSSGTPSPALLRGFQALPCSEAACRTVLPVAWPKEPLWLSDGKDPLANVAGLRLFRPDDLDDVTAIHEETVAGQRLRIDRDQSAWRRILRARERPRQPAQEEDSFLVIERNGRVEAYVVLEGGRPTLRWREHGARAGAVDLLADLFWAVLARARASGLQRIEGWCMPEVLTTAPLYPTSDRARKSKIVMLRSLETPADPPAFASENECRIWELDLLQSGL
jgi:hypothetical protein